MNLGMDARTSVIACIKSAHKWDHTNASPLDTLDSGLL